MTIPKLLDLLWQLYTHFGFKWIVCRAGYRIQLQSGWKRFCAPLAEWEQLPLESFLKRPLPNEPKELIVDLQDRPFFL